MRFLEILQSKRIYPPTTVALCSLKRLRKKKYVIHCNHLERICGLNVAWRSPWIEVSPFPVVQSTHSPHVLLDAFDITLSNGLEVWYAHKSFGSLGVSPTDLCGNNEKSHATIIQAPRGVSSLCDLPMTSTIGDRKIAIRSRSLHNLEQSKSTFLHLHHSSELHYKPDNCSHWRSIFLL